METALWLLDFATVVFGAILLFLLRHPWAKVATFLLSLVTVVLVCLQHKYEIPQIVLTKVCVNAAIPLVMALMGNYLAAMASESDDSKNAWVVAFCALAVLGIGGSIYLEIISNKDHKREVSDLKSDFREAAAQGVLEYNSKHPQNPITKEQFEAMIGRVSSRAAQQPTLGRYANTPSDALLSLTKDRVNELARIRRRWFVKTDDDRKEAWQEEDAHGNVAHYEEIRSAKDADASKTGRKETRAVIADIRLVAAEVRSRISLGETGDLPSVEAVNTLFTSLTSDDYSIEVLDRLLDYLNKLTNRLEDVRQPPVRM